MADINIPRPEGMPNPRPTPKPRLIHCDSCVAMERVEQLYRHCHDCGFCVQCAAQAMFEDEGLCPKCVFNVATWAVNRLQHHRVLDYVTKHGD